MGMPTQLSINYTRTIGLSTKQQQQLLFRFAVLLIACCVSFCIRLFAVIRYESIIHEFDPWFNFRATKVLVEQGTFEFWNWFDSASWYPLGRIVGGTVYPGIMYSAATIYHILHALTFPVDIKDVCVMMAPLFSCFTNIVTYFFTKQVSDTTAGLFAACFIAMVPGYLSRSVAGSYDNECVAITAMILCFFLIVKSVHTGSLFWSGLTCLAYLYMVASWGGYVFITNIYPIYVLVLILCGRYSQRLYVAYSTFYVIGTLLSMQIRFVGFQAVQSSEHMGALIVFVFLQCYCFVNWIRSLVPRDVFVTLYRIFFLAVGAMFMLAAFLATATGYLGPWTGRFYSLLDPTYASKHIPIIASVAEHQPTAWGSYFFDLHILSMLVPAGIYFCFQNVNDGVIFLILYGSFAAYFAGVMVRLMLVLAPAACVLSGIAFSKLLVPNVAQLRKWEQKKDESQWSEIKGVASSWIGVVRRFYCLDSGVDLYSFGWLEVLVLFSSGWFVVVIVCFCASLCLVRLRIACSEPSFRSSWLRYNTKVDAKILSWWDYGYQISGFANRTVIVDNNTWNNSHIATVGRVLNSPERKAFQICKKLDVDYVLVIFGGALGYSSDDINKFLWPIRISHSVDSTVDESAYLTADGNYRVGEGAGPALVESLMYKLCYYRFGEVQFDRGNPAGYDKVRGEVIAKKKFKLRYFEEAFTSRNWLVRIYHVKDLPNIG
ncbi:dolichyl-diphosphooligosaccharide--protein glycosyltransferase [Galdieria sulphuraria]|uniref:dolichyl-diphosphooligosaccharide--protein glycotransferase n=1 Tax=Galdieria sulphuraria TaxID=130081 RepID=M2W036_GALSU|nr:dolichyl-diphosphooligosaccharide--protein glycosyltransferase [Galdieria sulphuraria]EME28971.1 dolichyl-diphosphooligosaccharide--protein glycosyltransferase [Galdieria sulphuraria]|eukprot:XP_005705491.1 dolichyl-diphosphooligosaccharide--protein glycosyltransferase [Galdieria sulphuraria]